VISLPAWGILAIAAAALLSPVLAFLLAIAVEIIMVVLQDAGALKFVALAGRWHRGLILVSRAMGPAAREGQGRDLSRALRPRGWRGLR
jgi:hypothetical protein